MNYLKFSIFTFVWSIFCCSCNNTVNVSRNDPLDETLLHAAKEITIHDWTFDFDKFLTGQYYEEATFHFSDIFSNVEYIALEDAGENIIGNFDKTIVTEEGDFIFYDSYSSKIARFSSTGKFLTKRID